MREGRLREGYCERRQAQRRVLGEKEGSEKGIGREGRLREGYWERRLQEGYWDRKRSTRSVQGEKEVYKRGIGIIMFFSVKGYNACLLRRNCWQQAFTNLKFTKVYTNSCSLQIAHGISEV